MNKLSIASILILLLIGLMPSVSALQGIDNAPPTALKNDGNNNGVYEYAAVVSANVQLPAGARFSFHRDVANAPVLQEGNVEADRTIRIQWRPVPADIGIRNYILDVVDPNNNNQVIATTDSFALTVEGAVLVVNDVLLGGSGSEGERTNPRADDEIDKIAKKVIKDMSVQNTGDLPLTLQPNGISFRLQRDAGVPDVDYHVEILNQAEFAGAVIAPGTDKKARIQGEIVAGLHAVDTLTTLQPKQWTLGTVTVTPIVGIAPKEATVKMQAENMLEVKKIEVCATGVTERCKRYDKGDTVENLKPNDRLSITVIVENNFDDKSNLDIDGKVEIDTDDTDVIDLDENDEEDSVETNTETEFELSAAIEDDADGTGTLQIMVSGTDGNDALHGEKWDLKFKVEREAHEIAISGMRLNPTLVSCNQGSRDVQLEIDVRNIGKKKEREVKVEIEANRGDFKLQKSESDIEVDKNDELPVRFSFTVPVEVAPGTYPIEIKTFTKRTLLSDTETTTLTVPDCGFITPAPESEPQDDEQKREDEVVVTAPSAGTAVPAPAGTVATATPVAKKATKTFTASNAYIGALVAIIVVLLVIGGILVAMIVRKQ